MKQKEPLKKNLQIGVRIDEELARRLKAFEEATGIPPSSLARSATEAALNWFEHSGQISFPLACLPKPIAEKALKK